MTVAESIARVQYNGSGSTGPFAFNFKLFDEEHIRVVRTVSGVDTVLTLTTDYSVTLQSDFSSATVTLVSALAVGQTLTLLRDPPAEQQSQWPRNDPFPSATHERAADLAVMLIQVLQEKIQRAPLLAESSTFSNLVLPDPSASKFLGWNSAGTALENKTLADAGVISLPGSSTDNALVRFDGTTGASLQNSGVTVDDSNNMAGVVTLGAVNITLTGYCEFTEISEPSSPSANLLRLFGADDGLGRSVLKVKNSAGEVLYVGGPEILRANRTYYVRTDGSNSNTGLVDSAGGAFLTLQKAIDTAYTLDLNGFAVTIDVGNGTYTGGARVKGQMRGQKAGVTPLTFLGDATTPGNVIISTTSADCFLAEYGAEIHIEGFRLQTTTSGKGISATGNSKVTHGNMAFGSCVGPHKETANNSEIICISDYSIIGGAESHQHITNNSYQLVFDCTVTLTGTPVFSAYFLGVNGSYAQYRDVIYSGSATGQRYFNHENGVIDTNGEDIDTYFPGNSIGSLLGGAQFDDVTDKIHLKTAGEINFGNSNVVLLHATDSLIVAGGVLDIFNDAGLPFRATQNQDTAAVEVFRFQGDRATPTDGDSGFGSFRLSDDAGTQREIARFTWTATDVNDATGVDGRIVWGVMDAGTITNYLTLAAGSLDMVGDIRTDTLRIDQTPTAVSGAGPIAIGSGSTINRRISISMNGTTYWIPASTTAF